MGNLTKNNRLFLHFNINHFRRPIILFFIDCHYTMKTNIVLLKEYLHNITTGHLKKQKMTELSIKKLVFSITDYTIEIDNIAFDNNYQASKEKAYLHIHLRYKTKSKKRLTDDICIENHDIFEFKSQYSDHNVKIIRSGNIVFLEFFMIDSDRQEVCDLIIQFCATPADAVALFEHDKWNESQGAVYDFIDDLNTVILQCKSVMSAQEMSDCMNYLFSREGVEYGLSALENQKLTKQIDSLKDDTETGVIF